MVQPTYTLFSNYNHYTKCGNTHCDRSFDPSSLSDYIRSLLPQQFTNDSRKGDSKKVTNDLSLEDKINKTTGERDKANNKLKIAKEIITTLKNRVNVLELELVAQQSTSNKQCSLTHPDIESILESITNEYIILKEKCSDISKKIVQCQSLESRYAFLENENKQPTFKEKHEPSGSDTCSDLENIVKKQNTGTVLVNLQKESFGKISPNLLH